MTATPTCKPWCTDHQTVGEDACYTRYVIYDNGEVGKSEPAEGSMAAQLRAVGGFPGEISWIAFVASQDEEDEHPVMDLQFYEAGADEANCTLPLNASVLTELRSSLGSILSKFS
ncbi:hypothetical protein [Pseudarthrobacter sp. IC2-21]|uniref:hypothetical protein n=1 Tax=Pseudarthrobacter sp. IC2-21 TaxID=3092262 RepID=UPI002A6ABEBB|nr:hypothetical protein [Pseudarthrobacter sp. IC2-21]